MVLAVGAIFNCHINLVLSDLVILFEPSRVAVVLPVLLVHLLDLFLNLVLRLVPLETSISIIVDHSQSTVCVLVLSLGVVPRLPRLVMH